MVAVRYTITLTLLFTLGCASQGFNRGALRNQVVVRVPVVDDKEIATILKKRANLPRAFKLAIYFTPPPIDGNWQKQNRWRWTQEDKEYITDIEKRLIQDKLISKAFIINNELVNFVTVRDIRVIAARHGADAVLIINGTAAIDRYLNKWGWTYFLLFPTLFVAGSEAEALFLASASMWDVRNGYLYLSAEVEAQKHSTYVAAFGNKDQKLIDLSKTEALKKLRTAIVNMIKGK